MHNYSEKELTKLLADVEKEFTSHMAKAEELRLAKSENESAAPSVDGTETLAKAEDEKPAEAKDKKDKKEPKSEAPAPEAEEEAAPEAAPAEAEGEEEGQEDPAAQATDEDPAAEGDASGYDAEDLEHLRQMYASMSFDELMAHHDAVKECLDAQQAPEAAVPAEEAEAPVAPEAPAEAAAPSDESAEKPFGKSENTEVTLVKSELDAEKAKSAELKKNLDAVSEFVGKLLARKSAPAGKAITSLETIAKSEVDAEVKVLSKGEVTAILSKKAADPKLSTSDRQAINTYYGAGQVSIEKISHLLK